MNIDIRLKLKLNVRRERNTIMKKNGFTLAEVLITLAIIGVVATLTLPALMTNTAEQQARSAFKKGINTLTEVAQMNQAIAGFDYASLTEASTDKPETQSLYGLLANRAAVDFAKNGLDRIPSHQGNATGQPQTGNFSLFFRDGSALIFPQGIVSTTAPTAKGEGSKDDGTTLMPDGLVYGITAIYDTNGAKGPNIVSNCNKAALGVTKDSYKDANTEAELETKCSPANRVIKDQFGVRLRGGFAVPNGAAARWVMQN